MHCTFADLGSNKVSSSSTKSVFLLFHIHPSTLSSVFFSTSFPDALYLEYSTECRLQMYESFKWCKLNTSCVICMCIESYVMASHCLTGSRCSPWYIETEQCIWLNQQRTAIDRQLFCTCKLVGITCPSLNSSHERISFGVLL